MAQFDLYEYSKPGSSAAYLLDVQNDLLETLQTQVIKPHYPVSPNTTLIRTLNPTVELADGTFFLSTAEMAAVRDRELRQVIGSLHHMRDEIIASVDLLFTGI